MHHCCACGAETPYLVSAGCDHCYAFTLHDQRHAAHLAGKTVPPQYHRPFSEVQLLDDKRLSLPLRWTKPRRIFVDSMSDLFHADVPTEFIADVFAVMAMARRHTFQVLTKRTKRMNRLVADRKFHAQVIDACWDMVHRRQIAPHLSDSAAHVWPLPNVWLGTSVENQEAAYRIDWLVKTPAAVRFLSCEPLIGALDLSTWVQPERIESDQHGEFRRYCAIDWVIAGAESGPGARPAELDWFRVLRDQCVGAGVPYFLKQFAKNGKKIGLPELDGVQWAQIPAAAQRIGGIRAHPADPGART